MWEVPCPRAYTLLRQKWNRSPISWAPEQCSLYITHKTSIDWTATVYVRQRDDSYCRRVI